jgi:hypothetical protein
MLICHVLQPTLFSIDPTEYEVSVLELYEDREGDTSGVFDEATFSSLTAPPPQVLQQTYTFRTGVRTLAVSTTRRGLTSKDFLCMSPIIILLLYIVVATIINMDEYACLFIVGLNSGQVLAVAKHFLDPRRPVLEPDTPRAEGVIPYMKELPSEPLAIISYNQSIANIKGIATASTLLESTSMVFVYGIDLFFTRVTPSQPFDLLNEGNSAASLRPSSHVVPA